MTSTFISRCLIQESVLVPVVHCFSRSVASPSPFCSRLHNPFSFPSQFSPWRAAALPFLMDLGQDAPFVSFSFSSHSSIVRGWCTCHTCLSRCAPSPCSIYYRSLPAVPLHHMYSILLPWLRGWCMRRGEKQESAGGSSIRLHLQGIYQNPKKKRKKGKNKNKILLHVVLDSRLQPE